MAEGLPGGEVRAGVIGLGMMGGGIAGALARAGLPVAVHDVRPEAATEAVAQGARWCDTPAEVAEASDVVVVVVLDAAQTTEVLFGTDGIASARGRRPVVGMCATVDAADAEALAERGAGAGLDVLDVGIAGGPDAAGAGTLVTMVGGPDDAVARAATVLGAMSVRVVHAGGHGDGMRLKLVKNAMSYATMCAVHETQRLGEELGFEPALVREVAADTNLADHFFWFPLSRPTARPLDPDRSPEAVAANRHFAALAVKDLDGAIAAADAVGVPHPALDVARARVDAYFLLGED